MDLRWHLSRLMATTGLSLLRRSGWLDGYWKPWRGDLFRRAEAEGIHVLPVHFYTPIPDTRTIDPDRWKARRSAVPSEAEIQAGADRFERLGQAYDARLRAALPRDAGDGAFDWGNTAFGPGDADALFMLIQALRPQKLVEIGSGHSTLVAAAALRALHAAHPEHRCHYTTIDPYPPDYLSPPPPEVSALESRPAQAIDPATVAALAPGDILFIDSTHVVRPESDVVHEFTRLLPHVPAGVIVHVHDIFLPYEYPLTWMTESRFFWNEQYLLEAVLALSDRFRVILPVHAVLREHAERLQPTLSSLDLPRRGSGSFWMIATGGADATDADTVRAVMERIDQPQD